ncbi:histone acetyltransferase HAC1-like isoform X2 [Punica granatum]|uniref:histone acetyltransferase n=2 Tax=Punica granatum TaxID=22663 RepID=A0A218WBK6_PUNGR|nr:histone acetyltransferase HAC1-like isoform X2 [Punica granatum]OWM69462.1 hypothetical protein CDL15_Pgr013923 [Punica granatum]
MNVQAHMSGQVPGHVPNQTAAQVPQRNGNPSPYPVQSIGPAVGAPSTMNMDPELLKARGYMQEKIFMFLVKRQQQQPINEAQLQKFKDIVKRLEEGLFKLARTQEEYMNLATLESRLHNLLRRSRHPPASSAMSTMIPTPGMQHAGNSNVTVTSSLDATANATNSVQTTPATSSTLMPNGGLPNRTLNRADGSLSNGYQQAQSHFSMGSGGHNMQPLGVQRMNSQMIPTPGFNNNSSSQVFMNVEASNSSGRFSTAESANTASHSQHQKLHVGGQNSSHMFHGQSTDGIRSGMQQRYGFPNGAPTSGFSMVGNNMQLANGASTSDSATPYGSSPKISQHHFDQYHRPSIQGEGYASSMDASMNSQSISKSNTSLVTTHSNLPSSHQAALSLRENLLPAHQQQQFQLQSHFQQQPQQYLHQKQQLQHNQQHQHINDAYGPSQGTCEIGNQLKQEPGGDHRDEIMQPPTSEHLQLSEFQNQFQQISTEENSRAQFIPVPSVQHNVGPSLSQNAQQIQRLSQPGQLVDSRSEFSHLPVGMPPESVPQGQWQPGSQDGNATNISGNQTYEQRIKDEFHQRVSGQEEAECNNVYTEGCSGSFASQGTAGTGLGNSSCKSASTEPERNFFNQRKWLLFLRHARRCNAPPGKCQAVHCVVAQRLIRHMESCSLPQCPFPRCRATKVLVNHHKRCVDPGCPVCIPVKAYLQGQQLKSRIRANSASPLPNSVVGSCKPSNSGENSMMGIPMKPPLNETSEELMPSQKRMRADVPSQPLKIESENTAELVSILEHTASQVGLNQDQHTMPVKKEFTDMKMEVSASSEHKSPFTGESRNEDMDNVSNQRPDVEPVKETPKQNNNQLDKEADQVKQENNDRPDEPAAVTKSGKPKIKGVSLTELFTPEQVREHIIGLRQWVGQSKAKAEKNQAMEHSMSENSCQLCAVEKLTFEPPPIYCTPCGSRIKRNAMYYTAGAGDTRHYFCIPCYNEARGDTIVADGMTIPKSRLEKKKNDEETEEWWVQCDKCEAWQHQICALFNGRRNDGGQAEYTCPNCYIAEVERGERTPLPQSAVLGAKDLPKTILSDHIEQRLAKRLKQERQDRAKFHGKSYDEVPGAESLVVRVVSSVDKKLEVKQRFLEIFQEENYPTEFPYKSKVILLFQKIEGVEVCLFGMYVQEFGSECQFPNQRRVYLSYLDSVKYFRPEVKAVTGEALRTFVYHEILIGYLEYCKLRGFTSCYIWACPPLKGEDYILYCHPEIQKTPKSDKLREWYLAMLRKAMKENIVADLTNLYDHFFTCTGECKARVTAARLPYFDGDYWPGAAEELIYQIRQEEEGRKQNKKGPTKKTITKRALKASGQSDLSGNASKDLLLMHKLGETISPMKEDFIMVHLQHACSHCCILMVAGNRWVCNQCKNFQICDKCYDAEQRREERDRHPVHHREKHTLYPNLITNVPEDTKDKDEILESEFFDTRQAFLSLCQGNHYQYDTLRRAKHSSMMVLYHLHNPTAPAFVTTCNMCHLDIEAGQGWRCEVCPDYDVCNSCYHKGIDHPHKLTNHPSIAERDAQNKEARQMRVLQLRKMLDLLVHASQCRSAQCQYPNCRKVKGLFRHGIQCKIRASGGCVLCKKMWYLLQLHARACKESECHVPRCRDLKEHLRRLQQQSDTRRRAAVMEMMRQRAAEVASNAG